MAALQANTVDFNNTSDLTADFNGSTSAPATNASSGGLNNSGSVTVNSSGVSQIWTSKESLSLSLGTTLSVSLYFYNATNSGFGGLGFAVGATNNPSTANGSYLNEYSAANSIGTVVHGGGSFTNNSATTGTGANLTWATGDMPLNTWVKITFTLTETGANIFDGSILIQTADSKGAIISTLDTQSFTGYQNTALGGASAVHAYFSSAYTRFSTADNFTSTSTVPEPSTYGLIALGALAPVVFRRRAGVAA